jgi:hypothetical protein
VARDNCDLPSNQEDERFVQRSNGYSEEMR